MPKYACPNNPDHKTFYGTGSLLLDYVMNEDGEWIEDVDLHRAVDGPFDDQPEDITCNECDVPAIRLSSPTPATREVADGNA